jgi:hypothetical protein
VLVNKDDSTGIVFIEDSLQKIFKHNAEKI